MNVNLSGKVALVTASSKGIGLAIAEEFLKAGADVAICARNADHLDAAREKLAKSHGSRVLARTGDIADHARPLLPGRAARDAAPGARSGVAAASGRGSRASSRSGNFRDTNPGRGIHRFRPDSGARRPVGVMSVRRRTPGLIQFLDTTTPIRISEFSTMSLRRREPGSSRSSMPWPRYISPPHSA